MVVDAEALVCNFLRSQSEVTTLCGDRVYTDMPHERTYPLVLVTRIGGTYSITRPLWLDNALVQLDAMGGTHKQAQALMGTCVEVLAGKGIGLHPEGAITGVTPDAIAYNPEPDFIDPQGHARPRFTCTVYVLTHP